jgi:hypothetical protein
MRYLHLLGAMDWERFPERDLKDDWGKAPVPYASFAAAYLIKLDQGLSYMSQLRTYLAEHPALVWILGFPLERSGEYVWGFDTEASLPTKRHLSRMLREIPNESLQILLTETVRLLQAELSTEADDFGQCISLDTKHIIAWVKENNPKAYVSDRYDKGKQPTGDPDCRLGCKRRHNQRALPDSGMPTPLENPVPASQIKVGEFYWGYATGVVATKVPDWGEFVLAELTQTFDRHDVTYFYPLMRKTEHQLGFRPHFAALDKAYDCFYVYEYFHRDDEPWKQGFAAVPLSKRRSHRNFSPNGLPLCKADLPMPLKATYMNRTSYIEHERGRYMCPLQYPEQTADACPIDHKNWAKGGCCTRIPTSIGSRLRHWIDRDSAIYHAVYDQRTATERINSQATELGIERPKLRNQHAITNQNTLIYVLINLRALHRVRQQKRNRDYAES